LEGVEARTGARLSPGAFLDAPHALLPTHIKLQKKSLDFVWPVTYGHHCTPFPPTSRPQTVPSSCPFKIDTRRF